MDFETSKIVLSFVREVVVWCTSRILFDPEMIMFNQLVIPLIDPLVFLLLPVNSLLSEIVTTVSVSSFVRRTIFRGRNFGGGLGSDIPAKELRRF